MNSNIDIARAILNSMAIKYTDKAMCETFRMGALNYKFN